MGLGHRGEGLKMDSQEIKELLDEVKVMPSGSDPIRRAELLAKYLQAYHLAIIGERLVEISFQQKHQ